MKSQKIYSKYRKLKKKFQEKNLQNKPCLKEMKARGEKVKEKNKAKYLVSCKINKYLR